jgi:secreted Zn-dependent insulinase-like peptidase
MDIDELIGATVDQQPTRFANAFDAIMRQKIDARLEDERVAYAQQMFAEPEEIDDEDEDADDAFDEEDFEIDDEELEDLEDLDTEEDDDDGEDA